MLQAGLVLDQTVLSALQQEGYPELLKSFWECYISVQHLDTVLFHLLKVVVSSVNNPHQAAIKQVQHRACASLLFIISQIVKQEKQKHLLSSLLEKFTLEGMLCGTSYISNFQFPS